MLWRTLYRIYLYLVSTLLLTFTAVATAMFLAALFHAKGLDGPLQPVELADQTAALTRATALAAVSWVVTLVFGGLHYWLLRRDIAADSGASGGPVRALFLNLTELGSGIAVAITGGVALTRIGTEDRYGTSGALGPAIAFTALFTLLELERRRGQPRRGGALVLQRLHFYGGRLILLVVATFFWVDALNQTVARMLISSGSVVDPCLAERSQFEGECFIHTGQFLGNVWLAAAWTGIAWLGYGLLVQGDIASRPRQVLNYLGLAYGVVAGLVGVQRVAEVVLRSVLGAPERLNDFDSSLGSSADSYALAIDRFSFVAPLVFGIAAAAVCWLWLASDARRGGPLSLPAMRQTTLAVTAALLAFPFWYGCAETLNRIFARVVPDTASPDSFASVRPESAEWAIATSFIVAGIAYIPLALLLSQQARATGVTAPRRGFVFTMLGLGTIAGAISLIFALYAFMSNALGAPLNNWEQLARQAVANVVIGALIAGIYVSLARAEGWFSRQQPAGGVAEPVTMPVLSVEGVLDELLAGRLSRDEAAARIRALAPQGA